MSGYIPLYTISNKMLELVSEISEKVGRITSHKELESKPHLRRNNRIRSIHSSLKIEANSLSLNDVRDVINGHLVLDDQKEIQEVQNAYVAYEKIPEIDPTSISDLKRIHGILTYRTARESGIFRKGDEGVIHPLILSAIFHYKFVFIHPFADGNGRMARLWHTVLLYRWRSVFEYIPLESQVERFLNEYYDAIAVCHTKGNSDIFIEFMLDMINQILDEVVLQVNRSNSEVSEYVKRMLAVMEYEVPYTSNSIMEALGLKSKETLRKNYINPAMELGLIKMTLPDKPNSRNQRYVKQ